MPTRILKPKDASIYNNLGNSYAQLKRYQEAVAARTAPLAELRIGR
jgi:hypothetical protein